MSDTLVYSAWSKDIDPLFASDKSMLYPTPTDIYSDRRMSDSTTSESNSPATEPDLSALDPIRKPSLPGLDQLLEPVDSFTRRPSMISDLSLSNRRSTPGIAVASHHLSSYSFPAIGLDNLGGSGGHGASPNGGPGATTPATSNSPYSVAPSDSPQFSTIPWSNDIQQQQQQQHSHSHHHVHHIHHPSSSSHHSASVSPPLDHSPKRRRSPAMSPPSPHHHQQLTPTGATSPATSPTTSHSHSISSQQSQPQDASQPVRRPRGKLPKHTTDLLKEWLHAHSDHPYPSEDEKRDLCNRTKLSMSQVSNWMINARRRILAPANKPQSASSVTSDPYRSLPRQIGSMYPSHVYAPPHTVPGMIRRPPPHPSQDTHTLRLYDPPYYPDSASAAPRYQAQSHPIYPQDRRLSYPNSAPPPPPYPDYQSSYSQFNSPRDLAPRYFTSHTDSL